MKPVLRTALAAAMALATVAPLSASSAAAAAPPPEPAAAAAPAGSYTNPVSAGFADTFADPAVIRGRDGAWYAYGTLDPLREGEGTAHWMPVARSTDLVSWTHVGDVFAPGDVPDFAEPSSMLWAPDVRYLDGRYVVYYTVTNTKESGDTFDTAIGVATAPTPLGPWTHSHEPVVAPRKASGGGYQWTIDPAQLTAEGGRKYLYWGSYAGGLWVTELSPDGLRAVGEPTHIAINDRFEGSYVVRRGGYYYLFGSSANCCAGPATGYSVSVGRSRSPRGPFVDRDGIRLDAGRPGGTPVVWPNGNNWIGAGHNAVVTDLAGQDWMVYHAIHRSDPYLDKPYEVNERPMLVDRLDWIDGWPLVRAGRGPSEEPQTAPVTDGPVDDAFAAGELSPHWHATGGGWSVAGTGDAGVLRRAGSGAATLVSDAKVPADRRVEADLRVPAGGGAAGLVVADGVTARVGDGRLTLAAGGRRASAPLPAGFTATAWHNLAVEARGRSLTARLTHARLGDPGAEVRLAAPENPRGRAGVLATGTAEFDNVSAAALARTVGRAVPAPGTGAPLDAYSEEFAGSAPGTGWSWVRRDPAATVSGGALRWPVQDGDLVGDANAPGVLLRDAPAGDYVVETRLTLDLGEETVRNYQQAGLVAYAGDDDFARLTHVSIWNTRQVEFGRELPFAGRLAFGGVQFGTPATTTWLRLAHRVDPGNGEHEFRAGASRDGRHWTWSGVWTFPAGAAPRIGLLAQGGATPATPAEFDYVRFYRAG